MFLDVMDRKLGAGVICHLTCAYDMPFALSYVEQHPDARMIVLFEGADDDVAHRFVHVICFG